MLLLPEATNPVTVGAREPDPSQEMATRSEGLWISNATSPTGQG
jgi:hypothetical protein